MTTAGSEPAATMPTKFSDLVGYLQLLQTRIGITLTVIGLTGAAAGTVAPLLPHLPDGAVPVLVYLAAIALTVSAYWVAQVIGIPAQLRQLIFERLKTRSLPSVDFVETELHSQFVVELERKQNGLRTATRSLIFGLGVLFMHAYLLILLKDVPRIAALPADQLKFAEDLGLPSNWSLFTIFEGVAAFLLIVYTLGKFIILQHRPISASNRTVYVLTLE
jgi:hypothetical protein